MTTNQIITCQISWKQWASSPDSKFFLVTWTRHIGSSSHNKGNLSQRKILLCRDFHKNSTYYTRESSPKLILELCGWYMSTDPIHQTEWFATKTGHNNLLPNRDLSTEWEHELLSHVTPIVSLPASCTSQQKEVRPETSPEFWLISILPL